MSVFREEFVSPRVERRDSVKFRECKESEDLVILVGGIDSGFIDPKRFPWFYRARGLAINQLFIRCNYGLWYHRGLTGITGSLRGTARFLDAFRRERDLKRVVFLGGSSGGYAALLLGQMIGANAIHASVPQTRLHRDQARFGMPASFIKRFEIMQTIPSFESKFVDVRDYLYDNPHTANICRIYYDPEFRPDRHQAERLFGLKGVEFVHQAGGHSVTKALKQRPGFFEDIIDFR